MANRSSSSKSSGGNGKGPMPPGHKAPNSGLYDIVGPRGGDTGQQRTVVRGEPLPPTPEKGQSYVINKPAHNGAGDGAKK